MAREWEACNMDVCSDTCPTRDKDMCDEVASDQHLLNLMENWGYQPLMPDQVPEFPKLGQMEDILIGAIILLSGLSGAVSNFSLLSVHFKFRDNLLDPTGLLLANFLMANLAMSALQSPFSASSAFAERWLYGDVGCQIYAAMGFLLGIGVVFSMGLLILDRYFQIVAGYRPTKEAYPYWFLISLAWLSILIFVVPPLLGVFGRFGMEPSGTMCTLDYWHGNFRNYNAYVIFLVVLGFALPIGIMLYTFLKSVQVIQMPESAKIWTPIQLQHHLAMVKVCGLLFLIQMVCWTPYAVLVIWTVVFPPTFLNIHYTLIPPIMCKIAPVLNACAVWWNVPRIQAGYRYLKMSGEGELPDEMGDMTGKKREREQTEQEEEDNQELAAEDADDQQDTTE